MKFVFFLTFPLHKGLKARSCFGYIIPGLNSVASWPATPTSLRSVPGTLRLPTFNYLLTSNAALYTLRHLSRASL
jgi:hypothetical protein